MIAFTKDFPNKTKEVSSTSYIDFDFIDKYQYPLSKLVSRWITLGSMAFVLHKYWQWFIVDTFDVPALSTFNMLGILFAVMMLRIKTLDYKSKPNEKEIKNSVFFRLTTAFWFFFVFGWICKFFMGLGL